jgi:hypothetical protein
MFGLATFGLGIATCNVLASTNPDSRIIAAIVFAGVGPLSLWGVLRTPFLRVVATGDELVVHSLFRNRRIKIEEVESVDCVGSSGVMPASAPALHLKHDGKVVVLAMLGSYDFPTRGGQSPAERAAAGLRLHVRRHRQASTRRRGQSMP